MRILARMTHPLTLAGRIPAFDLSDRMKKAREVAGFDQEQMAERAGVSKRSVSNYETGATQPRRSTLIAWALATGTDLTWLETGIVTVSGDPDGPVTERYPHGRVLVLRPRGPLGSRLADAA